MSQRVMLCLLIAVILIFSGCTKSGYKEVPRYTIEQFMDKVSVISSSFSHDESKLLLATDKSGIAELGHSSAVCSRVTSGANQS